MFRKLAVAVSGILVVSVLNGCGQFQPALASDSISISPQSVTVASGETVPFKAVVTGSNAGVIWSVNNAPGGSEAVGTIDSQGNYRASSLPLYSMPVTATNRANHGESATALVTVIPPGLVAPTLNPQVALYTISIPPGSSAAIQFGKDRNYGLTTWQQPAPIGGGAVNIQVAGMLANTTYHMRAALQLADGSSFSDEDHTFTTGALPMPMQSLVSASTTAGMTPQAGVELVSPVYNAAFATDLAGNIIWYYLLATPAGAILNPIKPLPNGHFVLVIAPFSSAPLGPPISPDSVNSVLEIDLAGNPIRELTMSTLNRRLANAGFNITALVFHHDILALPNGHFIALVNLIKQFNDLPGFPGTTSVLGDALVDLDATWHPVGVERIRSSGRESAAFWISGLDAHQRGSLFGR